MLLHVCNLPAKHRHHHRCKYGYYYAASHSKSSTAIWDHCAGRCWKCQDELVGLKEAHSCCFMAVPAVLLHPSPELHPLLCAPPCPADPHSRRAHRPALRLHGSFCFLFLSVCLSPPFIFCLSPPSFFLFFFNLPLFAPFFASFFTSFLLFFFVPSGPF